MRRKDDEKEQRIRHAVIELMLQEGFNGTSIAKIARLAGVSPATVYIYYENKEEMLQDIYLEYSEEVFDYLLKGIDRNMSSAQMIETLIRRYYRYMTLHPEAFCFVEQFANCPSLSSKCSCTKKMQNIFHWIEAKNDRPLPRHYSDATVSAILFYPVKAIAADHSHSEQEKQGQLEELIEMIRKALL